VAGTTSGGFTAAHRGGSGSPLVCLHGFTDTWRTWELVLEALERRHEVLAPTLAGHAGGPPLPGQASGQALADAVERAMDDAGFETAHIVGNSLGGYVTLLLAARGRARSVVALAPAGGWSQGDPSVAPSLAYFEGVREAVMAAAPHADAIMATPEGRRRATLFTTVNYEHIPAELLAHQLVGAARCDAFPALLAYARAHGWPLEAEPIDCPVRVVWGREDRILPLPAAAAGYRAGPLARAEWIELDGIGHLPQLDAPVETAQLILGFTAA
jgi:pimeloyl-ACP methyl ester carboxylesterase